MASTRERVVLREITGLGVALGDEVLEPSLRGRGGVLVEPARRCAGDEDAFDGAVLEGAVRAGVGKRLREVGRVPARAQRQHTARVVSRRARLGSLQAGEVLLSRPAQVDEGPTQLVEIRTTIRMPWAVPRERHVLAGAARLELVAGDAD